MKHFYTKIIAIMLALMPFLANAQITSGSIQGVIKDKNSQVSPGALVKAIHIPSGTTYGSRTNASGQYVINGLRVGGPYKVEVSSLSDGKDSKEGIYVALGTPTIVNLNFVQSGQQVKEVIVSGNRSNIFSDDKTGATTNVNAQQINALPTLNRRIEDFTKLTPQGGSSVGSNANSFGGRDARYNNFQVNGANLNNGFGLSSGLAPGGSGSPISIDAIEEFQIGVSPYDIKNAGFTGANINAVTRSGSNDFHGSVYGFFQNNGLNGDQVGPVNLDVPKFQNLNYGFRLGGAIVKNKLFFFVNAEREERTRPGHNFVTSNSTISGIKSRVPSDSMALLSKFLKDNHGYETGPFEGYANEFKQNFTKFLARIDWNINDNNKFYISYSQMTGNEDQRLNGTSATNGASRVANDRISENSLSFQNSNYTFDHTVRTITAELNSNMNAIMSNQLIGTYSFVNQSRGIPGNQEFPSIDINFNNTGINNYIFAGTDPFTYKNIVNNDNFNIINNLTINLKNNTLTIGAGYEHMKFGNSFVQGGNLYYRYSSLSSFMNNEKPLELNFSYPVAAKNGNTFVEASYAQLSAYVQDQVRFTDRFNMTFGVRFELPFYDNSFLISNPLVDNYSYVNQFGETVKFNTGNFPKSDWVVSPRVSFNSDVFGDKTLQIRGGTGIFTGRMPFVWLTNQSGGINTSIASARLSSAQLQEGMFYKDLQTLAANVASVDNLINSENISGNGTFNMVDENLKMPQVWRTDIGIDYKLPWYGLVATGEFIFNRDLQNLAQFNANLPTAQSTINLGMDNQIRERWTNRALNSGRDMFVLTNVQNAYSYTATFGLSKPASKGLFGSIFYTYTKSVDFTSNPGSRAISAWQSQPNSSTPNNFQTGISDFNTPHRIVGNISYKLKYAKDKLATTFSFFYEGSNPGRFSLVYDADINNDNSNRDLLYIPNDLASINFQEYVAGGVKFTADQQREAYRSYLNSINAEMGKNFDRNGGLIPWFHSLDFRVLQDFNFKVGKRNHTLQLSLDIFNLPNLINSNSGKLKTLVHSNAAPIRANITNNNVTSYRFLSVTNSEGKAELPTNAFRDDIDYNRLWRMQLGVRYIF
jgi:hypothetical protein